MEKPISNFTPPYSNVGLSCKGFEDICARNDYKVHFRSPHCHLRPPCHGTPMNIRMNFVPSKSKARGLHFWRW